MNRMRLHLCVGPLCHRCSYWSRTLRACRCLCLDHAVARHRHHRHNDGHCFYRCCYHCQTPRSRSQNRTILFALWTAYGLGSLSCSHRSPCLAYCHLSLSSHRPFGPRNWHCCCSYLCTDCHQHRCRSCWTFVHPTTAGYLVGSSPWSLWTLTHTWSGRSASFDCKRTWSFRCWWRARTFRRAERTRGDASRSSTHTEMTSWAISRCELGNYFWAISSSQLRPSAQGQSSSERRPGQNARRF